MNQATNDELSILNEEFENYFANTIIPQLFVDANLILRKYTPAACKQFTLTAEDIGKPINDIVQHIGYTTLTDDINEVIATGTPLEKEIQTTDKKWYQMNVLPYLVRKENRTNGVIITFVDITDRISALAEMAKLNRSYETFIYGILHDIKNPIFNIESLVDFLTEDYNENNHEGFTTWMEVLKKAVTQVKKSLDEFTDHINKKTKIVSAQESINIEDIFNDVKLTLKEDILNHNVVIENEFQVAEVTFSRNHLRSIIYNLLCNAIKYKIPGTPLSISVTTVKEENYIVLSVKDNGPGIAEADQQKIFNKYTRLSTTTEGTGMGLFIIKSMLENNDGKIEVNSTVGVGSTFMVYFKA